MWPQVVFLIVSLVLAYVLAPKPKNAEPADIENFDAPTADPNRKIPVVFGTVWIDDANLVWYGDLKTEKIKSDSGK